MYVMLQQLQVHTREVMEAQLAVQNMTMSMRYMRCSRPTISHESCVRCYDDYYYY